MVVMLQLQYIQYTNIKKERKKEGRKKKNWAGVGWVIYLNMSVTVWYGNRTSANLSLVHIHIHIYILTVPTYI